MSQEITRREPRRPLAAGTPTASGRPFAGHPPGGKEHLVAPVDHRPSTRAQAISNGMATLYKTQFGRGPEGVRTHFAGPDVVVTVLEGSMTPAERRLSLTGEHQRLRETRLAFQYAVESELRDIVERATGRRVRAFTSARDVEADVAIEAFVLDDVTVPGHATDDAADPTPGDDGGLPARGAG